VEYRHTMKMPTIAPQVLLAVRGTVAALLALAIAVHLHLECPYWAAMTALIVIQPTRGLLLEKSFYRLIGTGVGSLAGIAMLHFARSPVMLIAALALWLAGCVGAGNLIYGLRSYGAMVAACTGAVIALAGYGNPLQLHALAFGRVAGIIIGIVVSTTVTLFFTNRRSKRETLARLTKASASGLLWLSWMLQRRDEKALAGLRQDVMVEIAEVEGTIDSVWAGSIDLKHRKRQARSLIFSLLTLLEAGKLAGDTPNLPSPESEAWRGALAGDLAQVARHLDELGTLKDAARLEAVLVEMRARLPLLGRTLTLLVASLQQLVDTWDRAAPGEERPAVHLFIRHRDWREAGRAALRAVCAIAAVGALWRLTGWGAGPLMLVAASIMVSFFSTHDRPSVLLVNVFCGACVGVAAAFLCRLVLLPGVSDPLLQGIACIPVIMAGIIAQAYRRTALGAMDATLFFLLVMQPGVPQVPAPPLYLEGGAAALGGVAVAILAFRFLLPVDPARRLNSLLTAILRDLTAMDGADSRGLAKSRARTQHRVLRMLVTARKFDSNLGPIVEGGLSALVIGRSLQLLRELAMEEAGSAETSEAVHEATLSLSDALRHPETMLGSLEAVACRLSLSVEPYLETLS